MLTHCSPTCWHVIRSRGFGCSIHQHRPRWPHGHASRRSNHRHHTALVWNQWRFVLFPWGRRAGRRTGRHCQCLAEDVRIPHRNIPTFALDVRLTVLFLSFIGVYAAAAASLLAAGLMRVSFDVTLAPIFPLPLMTDISNPVLLVAL